MWNFELKSEQLIPSVESTSKKIKESDEYTSVNIDKTLNFCKEVFNTPENKKDICESLNNNFIIWLEEQNIDFNALLKQKLA